MTSTTLSIIVPTYKEALNVPVLSEKIEETLQGENVSYEIVFIDDNSNDGIAEAIEKLKKQGHPVNLKIRKTERGLSSAVIEGFRIARGEYFLVMDADLSHPVESIPCLLKPLFSSAADFCIGSRFVEGGSADNFTWFRKMNALAAKTMALPFTTVKDPMAGFFAFPRSILDSTLSSCNPSGFKIGLELMVKCRPKKIVEVPIKFQERLFGKSKLSLKEHLNYLVHLKRLFQYQYRTLSELVLFSIIGSIGMIVDLFFVFIAYDLLSLKFRLARLIGFIFALTSNFFLNRRFTFSHARHESLLPQYLKFFGVSCAGFCVNWLISVYCYDHNPFFHKFYLLAALLGVLGGFAINFLGSQLIVFKKKHSG